MTTNEKNGIAVSLVLSVLSVIFYRTSPQFSMAFFAYCIVCAALFSLRLD